jgi:hypothetical protein
MMAKMTTKSKSASLAKRGKAKTTGDEPFDVDIHFSMTGKKGYTINPWSRGSKNFIDVVFHDCGVPAKSEEPNITLNEGGSALRVEWKLPEKLFTATQATAQSIPVDSARYNGYCNTQDQMKAAGVHPVEECYRSVPQVVSLEHECTGVPKTYRFDVPTNNHVRFENGWHREFNSMYVATLQVAKDCHTLATGPKSVGIANFGDVEPVLHGYGGFGGGERSGLSGPPRGRVSNSAESGSDDKE